MLDTMETDSFINCMRRFIARRGHPEVLFSDNGTNFVGAYNQSTTRDDAAFYDSATNPVGIHPSQGITSWRSLGKDGEDNKKSDEWSSTLFKGNDL